MQMYMKGVMLSSSTLISVIVANSIHVETTSNLFENVTKELYAEQERNLSKQCLLRVLM